jgi:RHS repeat-associated protein
MPTGNLLSDGTSSYSYNHANRLVDVAQGGDNYNYAYNGLGDRLQQVVNGAPTSYTLDLNTGLTQVLADGANKYLYGNGRIGEEQATGWQYYMGDALGSVRQLVDPPGGISLARSYEPFGSPLTQAGIFTSSYGFAGEWTDRIRWIFLRARYMKPDDGRFLSKDILDGNPAYPISYVSWLYGNSNPINRADPSGLQPSTERWPTGCRALPDIAMKRECLLAQFAMNRPDPSAHPPTVTWNPAVQVNNATQVAGHQFIINPKTGQPFESKAPWGKNLCGHIDISMILETATGQRYLLGSIWEATNRTRSATSASDLAKTVLKCFPQRQGWKVMTHVWNENNEWIEREDIRGEGRFVPNLSSQGWQNRGVAQLSNALIGMLSQQHYMIPLVSIKQYSGRSDPGTLLPRTGVVSGHWVLLTGISASWQPGDLDSYLNWVRIKNPFRNRDEYYTWSEFEGSWASSRSLVEIWKE